MAQAATPRDQLDRLLLLFRRALRYWWLVGAMVIFGGVAGVGFAMTRPKRFQSETMVLYRELIPVQALQGTNAVTSDRNLGQRVHDMLFARPRLKQVVDEFKLYEGFDEVEAVATLQKSIVFRTRGTGTFHITFSDRDPETAQKVTARLADMVIDDDSRLRKEQAHITTNFLRAERDRVEGELKEKEMELAQFLASHPEFVPETSGQSSTGSAVRAAQALRNKPREVGPTDPKVAALERQRERIVARLRAPSTPVVAPTPRQPSPEYRAAMAKVDAAKRDLENARNDLERKQSLYTDQHPDVVAAKKRFTEAERRVADAEALVPRETDEPVPVPPSSANERAELERLLADLDRELAAARRAAKPGTAPTPTPGPSDAENWVVVLETQWQSLNREVTESRERYQTLEGRLFTAQIAASSELEAQGARMQVIDPAYLPKKPSGTPRKLLVLAGLFVFGGLGVGLALALALVDDRLLGRWDIEKLELLPVLVVVPKPEKKARRAA